MTAVEGGGGPAYDRPTASVRPENLPEPESHAVSVRHGRPSLLVSRSFRPITLVNGGVTLVDLDDFDALSQYRWRSIPRGYVTRSELRGGRHFIVLMHRQLLDAQDGEYVDHINRDPRDNRRSNLRLCNMGQNNANSAKQINNTSGFKGVFRNGTAWEARIRVQGRLLYLGRYTKARDAARAYDAAALKHWGEYALLNFPEVTS